MLNSQKKFQPNRSFLRPPKFPLKFGSDPFKGEKNNRLDNRVHGIQIDRLGLTVSMQKSVLKTMHRVPIQVKMYQILQVWFGRQIFDTFLVISWDSVHIF